MSRNRPPLGSVPNGMTAEDQANWETANNDRIEAMAEVQRSAANGARMMGAIMAAAMPDVRDSLPTIEPVTEPAVSFDRLAGQARLSMRVAEAGHGTQALLESPMQGLEMVGGAL